MENRSFVYIFFTHDFGYAGYSDAIMLNFKAAYFLLGNNLAVKPDIFELYKNIIINNRQYGSQFVSIFQHLKFNLSLTIKAQSHDRLINDWSLKFYFFYLLFCC